MEKICSKCRIMKPFTEYFFRDKKRNKLHAQCKVCYRAIRAVSYTKHYEKYREHYRERARIRSMIFRTVYRENLVRYLLHHPCTECGESDIRVLEFDHIDPKSKSFNIARSYQYASSWHQILLEIDKCRVLCANCHKRRTAKQFGWYKNEYVN